MEPIKDAFRRLIRFGHAAKERAMPVWKAAVLRSEPAPQWLKLQFGTALQWLRLRPRVAFWTGLALVVIFGFVIGGGLSWYGKHHAALAPLLTLVAGVSVAAVALIRHFAQTDADRQRRITESFSKAVEQLGSDKLEVRLGGIYSLERISKESPDDYWTVMENLTAFVRERSRRNEQRVARRAYFLWEAAGRPDGRADDFWTTAAGEEDLGEPAADIAAVLTVIKRRSEQSREREGANDWRFDLSGAILKRCNLRRAHLEGANLNAAHLEGASLTIAHLEGARLWDTHLEGAYLTSAHLKGAQLIRAHLDRANLSAANFERAHLRGADLRGATGLSEAQLRVAYGDDTTKLPEGMHWSTFWPVEVTYPTHTRGPQEDPTAPLIAAPLGQPLGAPISGSLHHRRHPE
jgi:Protein of unknown function (DUF2934)/Pentapeptide repeats (8 copies)